MIQILFNIFVVIALIFLARFADEQLKINQQIFRMLARPPTENEEEVKDEN